MRILIDTHILLWCLEDSPKLTAAARQLIENPDNEIYVSKATAWEIEIKRMIGKLMIADDFMERIVAEAVMTVNKTCNLTAQFLKSCIR